MTAGLEKRKMAAFSGRLGKNWLGVWARVRQHGEKRRVGCVRMPVAMGVAGADISFLSQSLPWLLREMAAGRGVSLNEASQNASTVGWLPFTCRM